MATQPSLTIHTRIAPRHVVKSGYLLRLEGNHRNGQQQQQQQWRRLFVVFADDLMLYDNESAYEGGSPSKGTCKLDAYTVLKASPPNESFEFTLLSTRYRLSITFRATSVEELECWYRLLVTFPECV